MIHLLTYRPMDWVALLFLSPVVAPEFGTFQSASLHSRIQLEAFFVSGMRNSLENRYGEFHYSVIDHLATAFLASEYVGRHLLYDDAAFDLNTVILGGSWAALTHLRGTSGSSPAHGRLHIRTGKRKIKLNDCDFVEDMQVALELEDTGIMGIDENIHATHPRYATVDPILDGSVCKLPADRGFTLNTGAADANGR